MRITNNDIYTTPAIQLYVVRTNLSAGTTGDTRFISDMNEMYTGKTPNFSVEFLNKEIKNKNQQMEEDVRI